MQPTDPPSPALEPSAADAAPNAAAVVQAEGVSAMLRVARGLLEGQRQIDLAGLDSMVGHLCARTLDLPPDQGRAMRPRLMLLLAELEGLASALAPP
jgi:hypothetical protein